MGSCISQNLYRIQKSQASKIMNRRTIYDSQSAIQNKYGIKNQKIHKSLKFECAPLANCQFLYNKFHHDSSRPDEINLQWQIEKVIYTHCMIKVSIINLVPVNLWVVVGGKEKRNMTGLCLEIDEYSSCEYLPITSVCQGQNAKIHQIKLCKKIWNQQRFKVILESASDPKQTLFLINTYTLQSSGTKLQRQELMWNNLAFELQTIYNQNQETLNQKSSGIQCIICNQQPSSCILMPCKHMCLCKNCLSSFRKLYKTCPLCKKQFNEIVVYKDVKN